MIIIRLIRSFVFKGLIAAFIASVLGVGHALITHSAITNITFSSANLLIGMVMIVLAGIIGGANMRGREEQVGKAIYKTAQWNSDIDNENMETSVSFSLTLGGASIIPLLVWAVTYYLF